MFYVLIYRFFCQRQLLEECFHCGFTPAGYQVGTPPAPLPPTKEVKRPFLFSKQWCEWALEFHYWGSRILKQSTALLFISITVGTKWVTLFSFLRLIEALSKFRQGTAFKVSKLEIFKLLLLNFETTLPTGISSFVYWFSYLLCLAFFQGLKCVCLSKDDLIVPFLDFETMPIQILKSTFVRNICNLSSEVYRDIEVSFFFKISIPLRSCLVFSYLKWRIISPFARSGDGIFTSIYHANSAAKVSMTPKLREFKEKQRCIYF